MNTVCSRLDRIEFTQHANEVSRPSSGRPSRRGPDLVLYRERRVRNRESARAWEIRTSLGPYQRAGADASGWLWEAGRGEQGVHVVIAVKVAPEAP